MASEAPVSDSVDPLTGINGLMLFPRTVRSAADVAVPVDARDLESVHNFMKSLELRSPEKVMNEAKSIVDGRAEFLDYNLAKFTETVGIADAIAANGKDRAQERRQGLGRARKRAAFSLKPNISQPSVCLEPTLDINNLQDPDEFFNAYEKMENAKKEIQKQRGGSMDNIENYRPSNNARCRRQGILGKAYNYKHRYSSEPSENDMLMLSPETVDQDIAITPTDESHENLVPLDPIPGADVEEVEPTVSAKKTESKVSNFLEELLSCNNEDLEGDGALNLLQERLNIKPLHLENLCATALPGVRTSTFTVTECNLGSTSMSTAADHLQEHNKSSPAIGSVLKNLSRKSMQREHLANINNPCSSPTPPRSPFASLSSLQKRILQPNPLKDPFSLTNDDLSERQNASPPQCNQKIPDQVAPSKDLGVSSELESCVEVDNREPVGSNMDAQKEMGDAASVPNQIADENANTISRHVVCRPNEEPNNFEKMSIDEMAGKSNPSVVEDEACDDTSCREQTDTEQQPEVPQSKLSKRRKVAGEKRTRKARTMKESLADKSNPPVLEDEARDNTSRQEQTNTEQQVNQSESLKGRKVAGENCIRKAHPMRKSLAECGTSFDTGVRRSKRIKMRPLEYWKGERFLYGRVGESWKLIGLKYISPGKDSVQLKVKPYNIPESSEFKELLELAARH